jgi:hypothetical protein
LTSYTKSYSVNVDAITTSNNNNNNIVYNQGDLNVDILTINLTINNKAMDLTTATAIQVFFQKQDGSVNMQDLSNGLTISNLIGGVLTLAFSSQTLSVPGAVQTEVHVTFPGNEIIVFKKFSFTVESALSVTQSQGAYQVLTPMQFTSSISNLPTPTSSYRGVGYFVLGTTGVAEVDTLTISAAPNANGNVTVTLNGVATTVAVAQGDTTAAVASKIGNTAFSGWIASVNGSTVTFTATTTGTKTAPSYNAGSTGAIGNMSLTTAGVSSASDGIYLCKKLLNDTYDWIQYA